MTTNARSIKNSRSGIALLIDNFLGEYQVVVRNAVEFAVREHGFDFFCFVGRAIDSPLCYERIQNDIFTDIEERSVSGVIVLGATLSIYSGVGGAAALCRRFAPLPVCCIGLEIDDVPSIVVNNGYIGMMAKHLVEVHDCRTFAFVGGPPVSEEARVRRDAFIGALGDLGISFDPALETTGAFTISSGYEAVERLLAKGAKFDALAAANDNMALGAISVLKKHGIDVPRDVCVTGFDDIPSARFSSPRLTTIRQPLEEIGRRAVESILKQIKGESVSGLSKIDPLLVLRHSCGCTQRFRTETPRPKDPVSVSLEPLSEVIQIRREALEALLASSVSIPEKAYSFWTVRLIDALIDEAHGKRGRLTRVLEDILPEIEHRVWLIDELHNAISLLREELAPFTCDDGADLELVWHDARVSISDAVSYGYMKNQAAAELATELFHRRASADLPSVLTRSALVKAVSRELEAIGITNGAISVFPEDTKKTLECIVAIRDGQPVQTDPARYPTETIVPPFLRGKGRMSYMVSPLTIGNDRLGMMVLELGAADLYYEILRDHVSSYLKSISIYTNRVEELQAEAEKKHHEIEMQHRQKLESLGVLAGGIAHDFNNMLSAMVGNLDVTLIDLEQHDIKMDALLECKAVVRHASGLCKQLLAYSGKGKFVVKRVNLNQIIRDLGNFLKMSVSKNVELRFELDELLPDIEADVAQMTQIFVNLVINAGEAIDETRGIVAIETGRKWLQSDYFDDSMTGVRLSSGEYVVAAVSDTGVGIKKENLKQIFDPFFTTKFTGRGLGLAAVLGIVRGHGGAIKVTSEEGQGTRFEILFPKLEARKTSVKPVSNVPLWNCRGTVLIVDDEPTVLRAGERLLKRMGFSVLTASDGYESIEIFQDSNLAITCVILDLTMPGIGGSATMAELKKVRPDVPVILSSGYSEDQIIEAGNASAPAAFLAKPYDFAQLHRVLSKVLADRTVGAPPPT